VAFFMRFFGHEVYPDHYREAQEREQKQKGYQK